MRFLGEDENRDKSETLSDKSHADATVIHDLCLAIRQKTKEPCLGYLESNIQSKLVLNLDPTDQDRFPNLKLETFEAFLSSTPKRYTRVKVGHSLALVVLSLGGSSWVPESWSKSDVFLFQDLSTPVPQPYLSHPSLRKTLASCGSVPTRTKAQQALFSLGVLLLELLFGEKLENQPFRAEYMGMDGKPNKMTDFSTAWSWQERVEEGFGDELAEAIERCLRCNFDNAPPPDLSNAAFLRAVWQQVLLPVEKFLSAWRSA